MFQKYYQSHGFTLLEVLVSVLILAVGMLGISVIQSRSLVYGQTAHLNTAANIMAYDMLDRIRANRTFSVNGTGYSVGLGSVPSAYPVNCEVGTCTPNQLANYDINQWKFILDQRLPNADGTITFVNGSVSRVYTITIFFDDNKGVSTARRSIIVEGGV